MREVACKQGYFKIIIVNQDVANIGVNGWKSDAWISCPLEYVTLSGKSVC